MPRLCERPASEVCVPEVRAPGVCAVFAYRWRMVQAVSQGSEGAMTKRKPKRKPRRVVLGIGWLYPQLGEAPTRWIHLRGEEPEFPIGTQRRVTQVGLRVKGAEHKRIRLVAEVLK